jgi:hypothetical protein
MPSRPISAASSHCICCGHPHFRTVSQRARSRSSNLPRCPSINRCQSNRFHLVLSYRYSSYPNASLRHHFQSPVHEEYGRGSVHESRVSWLSGAALSGKCMPPLASPPKLADKDVVGSTSTDSSDAGANQNGWGQGRDSPIQGGIPHVADATGAGAGPCDEGTTLKQGGEMAALSLGPRPNRGTWPGRSISTVPLSRAVADWSIGRPRRTRGSVL